MCRARRYDLTLSMGNRSTGRCTAAGGGDGDKKQAQGMEHKEIPTRQTGGGSC